MSHSCVPGKKRRHECCQALALHGEKVLAQPLGRGFLPFLCTYTCSGKRVAVVAVPDKGRTENQGVTITLWVQVRCHPGSSHRESLCTHAFVTQPSACNRLLLTRPLFEIDPQQQLQSPAAPLFLGQ